MNYLVVAAILPIVALAYYIYVKDVNREPASVLTKIFILGFASAIPVCIMEMFVNSFFPVTTDNGFLSLFVNTFLSVAIIEEGFKWLVTKKFGYNNREFDEVYDIIVYSVFASLGFACIENILYVCHYGLGNAILRAVLSVPGHTCFVVIMGYFFSKAKSYEVQNIGNTSVHFHLIFSLLFPALAHTIYDAFLFYMSDSSYWCLFYFFVFYIIMVIWCFQIVNRISKLQKKLYITMTIPITPLPLEENQSESVKINYCPKCGEKVEESYYCPYCGFRLK